MSSLTETEKLYFERLFGMQSGYVLDYSNATFGELFRKYCIDIHSNEYARYGSSKAKKLRAFWEREPDEVVGRVLSELLDVYEVKCQFEEVDPDRDTLRICRQIVARLLGGSSGGGHAEEQEAFLSSDIPVPEMTLLPVDAELRQLIWDRIQEAQKALQSGAWLSVVIMCGSILEGLLFGIAQRDPEAFGRSSRSAEKEVHARSFREWSLAQLIDAACDAGWLGHDVAKFSHAVRYFRNYIHPREQLASGFTPDEHTARICLQVVKAALADVVQRSGSGASVSRHRK